jgi:hypothetical protein
MSRPLLRAACLLAVAAACTRRDPAPASPPPAAAREGAPPGVASRIAPAGTEAPAPLPCLPDDPRASATALTAAARDALRS